MNRIERAHRTAPSRNFSGGWASGHPVEAFRREHGTRALLGELAGGAAVIAGFCAWAYWFAGMAS